MSLQSLASQIHEDEPPQTSIDASLLDPSAFHLGDAAIQKVHCRGFVSQSQNQSLNEYHFDDGFASDLQDGIALRDEPGIVLDADLLERGQVGLLRRGGKQ